VKRTEVIRRLHDWFVENAKRPECPLCLSNTFKAGRVCRLSGPDAAGAYLDVIPVVCANCAHVRLFSAAEIL
jgi:hypothetical protein